MKKEQRMLPTAMMLFCSGLTMAVLASEMYTGDIIYDKPVQYKYKSIVFRDRFILKKDIDIRNE
ncbi:hypothetical protein IRP16_004592 [Salmonella enterica]|nr:hypothetical protein [Salmonella enterica]EGM2364177.1 hypothetical protein [Salmonella enterica]